MKLDSTQIARQEATRPLASGDRLWISAPDAGQYHETGEVFPFTSQSVVDPGSHARPIGNDGAGVHEGMSGIVIDLLRHHRADDGDVIRHRGDVRQIIADQLTTLAVALEGSPRTETLQRLTLELCDGHAAGERFRHRLTVQLGELWLLIEGLQVTGAPCHAQEDDPLGPGRLGDRRQQSGGPELAECRGTDPHRKRSEELAAVQPV